MVMDQVDTLHANRYWSEVLCSDPLWVTLRSRSRTWKFCVKVFISLYLLNMVMDQVDTLHVSRYWSEVLCSTVMTHPE